MYVQDAAGDGTPRSPQLLDRRHGADGTLGANRCLFNQRRPTFAFTTSGGPTQCFCRIQHDGEHRVHGVHLGDQR
ncbi:MAG: hypothetical protein HS111_03140 [Kofleriaceae bacterium]|nr:hypothetical protein [Kofleriaceae bacterium]